MGFGPSNVGKASLNASLAFFSQTNILYRDIHIKIPILSWLDIKCIQRAAPKSWSEYTTGALRAASKSWLKYITNKVGKVN